MFTANTARRRVVLDQASESVPRREIAARPHAYLTISIEATDARYGRRRWGRPDVTACRKRLPRGAVPGGGPREFSGHGAEDPGELPGWLCRDGRPQARHGDPGDERSGLGRPHQAAGRAR